MLEYVEFHNPTEREREADLLFDLRRLPPQLTVSLRLSELKTARPLGASLTGVQHRGALERTKEGLLELIEAVEKIVRWLDERLDALERALGALEEEERRKASPRHRFAKPVYVAKPSALVEVRGVRLERFGAAAALIAVEKRGELPPGSAYTFDVQQRVRERLVGGSTFVVRIAGERCIPQPKDDGGADTERGEPDFGLPPWLRALGDQRNEQVGRE